MTQNEIREKLWTKPWLVTLGQDSYTPLAQMCDNVMWRLMPIHSAIIRAYRP